MTLRPAYRALHGPLSDATMLTLVAAALLVDAELCPHAHGISVPGVAAVAFTVIPLWWRKACPLYVLWTVLAGIALCLATLRPVDTAVLPAMVALFAVARHGDRRRSLIVAALTLPFVVFAVMLTSTDLFTADTVSNAALVLVALALGDTVRSRCAAHAAEEERVRQAALEAEHDADRRVAEERLRIAREVHDVVAHAMVAINVQAGVAAHVLDQRPEQVRSALVEIKRTSGEALTDLRATLGLLREKGTDAPKRPAESIRALEDLAAPLRTVGVQVRVRVEGDPAVVPAPIGAATYRIVQEALTNILRHAGAERADVLVAVGPGGVDVSVRDDGAAVPAVGGPAPGGSGHGLRGIRERVDAVGGSLDAGPLGAGGWRVHATLPL